MSKRNMKLLMEETKDRSPVTGRSGCSSSLSTIVPEKSLSHSADIEMSLAETDIKKDRPLMKQSRARLRTIKTDEVISLDETTSSDDNEPIQPRQKYRRSKSSTPDRSTLVSIPLTPKIKMITSRFSSNRKPRLELVNKPKNNNNCNNMPMEVDDNND